MNAKNYDRLMTEQINGLDYRPKLLLHCCCAPCSTACLERLEGHFDITVLFYNPNIGGGEYEKRKAELIKFINLKGGINFADCDRGEEEFYARVRGLESQKEGGKRCLECFELRLEKTACLADKGGYDYFATTLTVSPLKDAQAINAIGESLQRGKTKWLYSDFNKRNGYLRSIELSKNYGLYRQNYCGCVYSRQTLENK